MVALKKLFQAERTPSRSSTGTGLSDTESEQPYFGNIESPTRSKMQSLLSAGLPSPALPSPGLRAFQAHDVAHHFDQIEKQFEDLHQHLGERPVSSQSQYSPHVPNRFVRKDPNARHIDLMEAVAPSEQPVDSNSPVTSPPTSPYNEDVAERNMTRFLRIQHRSGFASSRILSALYQEDVADRNIAKYSGASRSLSSLSCRSSPPAPGRVRNLSPDGQRKRHPREPIWISDGNLRARSTSPDTSSGTSRDSQANSLLRQQRSAPSLSAEEDAEVAPPPVIQRLGVPPAHKQGRRWSNTPLPDSPTLPIPMSDGGSSNGNTLGSSPLPRAPVTTARSSSLIARSLSPPPSSGSASRKNVRDLSINTELAVLGRPKIAHRAIQPPTPSTCDMKRAPSIAEVMHSPLPEPSPPQPSPRFKASEMMDLFNKAYMSTQAISPHPTYESLQDAIVREINSHEAFKRVPVPVAGPPFTPSPTQETFDHRPRSAHPGLSRSASAGSISKIMRKSSFRKHKRNADSRQSISTSVPSKGYERIFRKASPSPSRRRHTDAPIPSPGLLADIKQSQETALPEQLTYMDVLYRASNDKPGTSSSKSLQSSRKHGRSDSTSNFSATMRANNSEGPYTPGPVGAIYCMQAHSTSSKDSQASGLHEDSDDDIIHLPSVAAPPPRVQIEAVDDNNVRYVIDSATATDAQRLMSWPQRSRRMKSPGPTSTACDNSLSPLSRARMQLRGTRSVEIH